MGQFDAFAAHPGKFGDAGQRRDRQAGAPAKLSDNGVAELAELPSASWVEPGDDVVRRAVPSIKQDTRFAEPGGGDAVHLDRADALLRVADGSLGQREDGGEQLVGVGLGPRSGAGGPSGGRGGAGDLGAIDGRGEHLGV